MTTGGELDIQKIEKGFRTAALMDGDAAFRQFLSSINIISASCPECGTQLKSIAEREKNIVSLLGTGTYRRKYYECPNGHGHFIPGDEIIGIKRSAYTPGVRLAISKLASEGSFEWSSEALAEITGIYVSAKEVQRLSESVGDEIESKNKERIRTAMTPEPSKSKLDEHAPQATIDNATLYIEYDGTGVPMTKNELTGRSGKQADGSAKTREAKIGCIFTQSKYNDDLQPIRDRKTTSYFGSIEPAENFGWRVYAEATRSVVSAYKRKVVIGDGAKWIWGIADRHFPDAIHIVDYYHAAEHLCKLTQALFADKQRQEAVINEWSTDLRDGNIEALVEKILSIPNLSKGQEENIRIESNFFLENANRMRYKKFKEMGLFVGSGVVEAGCKTVVGERLKQSGMFWSVHGANAIISLRCAELSCNERLYNHFLSMGKNTNYKIA